MRRAGRAVLILLFGLGLAPAAADEGPHPGQPASVSSTPAAPLVIGETFQLESKILGETRVINVYRPSSVPEGEALPVLYMPDGGLQEDFLHIAGLVQISSLNGTMRPHLLVGIENTERRRDLTGPTEDEEDRKIAPRVGGSAAFRGFLRKELIPAIEARYGVTAERAILGESLAGLFVVETLMLEPDLFDTYIAVDPSLWWNHEYLAEMAVSRMMALKTDETLFLSATGATEIGAITSRMVKCLRRAEPPRLTLDYEPLLQEEHHTIFHPAALLAVRTALGPPISEEIPEASGTP